MIASVAAILFAAAITPGPNNLVVMDAGRGGLRAALAPIAGVAPVPAWPAPSERLHL